MFGFYFCFVLFYIIIIFVVVVVDSHNVTADLPLLLYFSSSHWLGSLRLPEFKYSLLLYGVPAAREQCTSAADAATSNSYLPVDYKRLVPVACTIVRALGEVR